MDQLTISVWAESQDERGEALQALASIWRPPDEWPGFRAVDAAGTDGLPCRGYFGAVTDGRYIYFVPEQHGERGYPTHGQVLRLDTLGDLDDPASFAAVDAGHTGNLETRGYYGGVFDGRFVYFVPRQLGMEQYHSHVLRLDTQGDFRDPSSWDAHDAGEAHSQQSAAFDGRYIYFCPGFSGDPKTESDLCGQVLRLDTQAGFHDPASYTSVDLTEWMGPRAACFDGAAFDGRYIYFVPLSEELAVRFDTHGAFDDPDAWQAHNVRPLGFGMAVGAVFDGDYLYYCAYGHGVIVRFDTRRKFSDPDAWTAYNADPTQGLRTTGFDGGFFDGRFVYFQPFFRHIGPGPRDNLFHSHYLRYDVNRPFDDPDSWQATDASATDGLHSVGYNAGAFDGRYFYAAPWQQGPKPDRDGEFVTHGVVLRCDTVGDSGSFSLRWSDLGHNGGLNAGLCGPSLLINSDRGCVRAVSPRLLSGGRHHIVGTYVDGTARLYVDGVEWAVRDGGGQLLDCDLPLTTGRIQDGGGHFRGTILDTQLQHEAITAQQVRQAFEAGPPAR